MDTRIQGIGTTVAELRLLQRRAAQKSGAAATNAPAGIADALEQAKSAQERAQRLLAEAKPGNETKMRELMVELQKAEVAFQTVSEARNRMVSAYQEIMNMPV